MACRQGDAQVCLQLAHKPKLRCCLAHLGYAHAMTGLVGTNDLRERHCVQIQRLHGRYPICWANLVAHGAGPCVPAAAGYGSGSGLRRGSNGRNCCNEISRVLVGNAAPARIALFSGNRTGNQFMNAAFYFADTSLALARVLVPEQAASRARIVLKTQGCCHRCVFLRFRHTAPDNFGAVVTDDHTIRAC